MKEETDIQEKYVGIKHVYWDAIFAGTVTAIVIGSSLNLLGVSLGIMSFDPRTTDAATISTVSIIWIMLTTLIYSFITGWVSSYFSKVRTTKDGILQGFVAWSLAVIFTVFVLSSSALSVTSGVARGTDRVLTNLLGAVNFVILPQAIQASNNLKLNPNDAVNSIKDNVQAVFKSNTQVAEPQNQVSQKDINQLQTMLYQNVNSYLLSNNQQQKDQAKENAINLMVQNANIDRSTAENKLSQWQDTYQSLKQKTLDKIDDATTLLGKIMLVTFIMLLVGAVSSMVGGYFAKAGIAVDVKAMKPTAGKSRDESMPYLKNDGKGGHALKYKG